MEPGVIIFIVFMVVFLGGLGLYLRFGKPEEKQDDV